MLSENRVERNQMEMICIDDFVPEDHLLRKIEEAVEFEKIYEIVRDQYCHNNGRPSIDPVVLFKIVFIQHLYGIPSLRRTCEEIKMNVAYRWFLGYLMSEQLPHFSTVSYNFKHRFNEETIDMVFEWILSEVEKHGYLTPDAVFVDGTHIKANANMHKAVKKAIPKAAREYEKQLMEEVNADREEHGKKPFDGDDQNGSEKPVEEKIVTESTTDPESGVFHKGEHKKCFAYEAHTACDRYGYVMDVEVTAGNVHDSVAFPKLYRKLLNRFPDIEKVVADAGYKIPYIAKLIIDSGRIPVFPYKRPMGKDEFFRPYEYVYDKYYDCILCPENHVLSYSTTNRDGYREYKSKPYICENCPSRKQCTNSRACQKVVTRHIWEDYMERVEDYRHTPEYKELYTHRKETIERVFADAKEKHGMRYTPYRGLAQVTKWVRLKFAALNLKKLAIHLRKDRRQPLFYTVFIRILFQNSVLA
jgi:transposase/transcription elongation factor Elf1